MLVRKHDQRVYGPDQGEDAAGLVRARGDEDDASRGLIWALCARLRAAPAANGPNSASLRVVRVALLVAAYVRQRVAVVRKPVGTLPPRPGRSLAA